MQKELSVEVSRGGAETELESRKSDASVFSTTNLELDDAQLYGFVSRSEGSRFTSSTDFGGPPRNIVNLAVQAFERNRKAILGNYDKFERGFLTPQMQERQNILSRLTLNTTAISLRERKREELEPRPPTPLIILAAYNLLCGLIDSLFPNSPIERFYFLETVARMPYFSYISMLHLYESLGWWRRSSNAKAVHFEEEVNEYHHLLIMECLGGDQQWSTRFLAQVSKVGFDDAGGV